MRLGANKMDAKKVLFYGGIATLFLLSALVFVFNGARSIGIFKVNFFKDFYFRWQECAYTLHGINPIDTLYGKAPVNAEIGQLPDMAGTIPWGYTMGNLFVFGFLPYKAAVVLGVILFASITVYTFIRIYIYARTKCSRLYSAIATLLIFFNPIWVYTFGFGNMGGICCCMILLAIFNMEKHPYLSGALFAFAMLKPQLTALFFISLFLQKRWKTLFSAIGIVSFFWALTSVITKTSPIKMLFETGKQGMETYQDGNFGIFYILYAADVTSKRTSVILSAILGVCVVLIFSAIILKNERLKNNLLFFYSVPAVASTFWFYKQPHDLIIIFILALATLEFVFRDGATMRKYIFFSTSAFVYGLSDIPGRILALIAATKLGYNWEKEVAWLSSINSIGMYIIWLIWFLMLWLMQVDNKLSRHIQKVLKKVKIHGV
ncbi:MAG: DUF2029 domain-containing protein [Oscillospiraceae bacterium]|jgi:hypothetical protein|nr:DUF2029 domain-containing protein [Oscillospiraceae bacterium]